ncbi:DUF1533 domain-containing protein [Pelotomaculum isophthalicicum JI]|uniref:DUF1533 domain-containing protein n=1 Tax=Pelotomaculum isophthalicicum JI TaxID=947010 RepID=A0A9X4H6M5_9FIRM|nr:hemoblobin-interacting domain-containing protein [Pelotomaculum isophthalicicum]MDF9409008.1 DUF1533 domain-containing protein [Pelotomaculum isophthalicicum JI]
MSSAKSKTWRVLLSVVFVMAMLFSYGPAANADESTVVTVGAVTGEPGTEIQVPVYLNSTGNVAVGQFDMYYDSALLTYTGYSRGDLVASTSHSFIVSNPSTGPKRTRVIISSNPKVAIPAGSGTLIILKYQVAAGAQPGQSCTLQLVHNPPTSTLKLNEVNNAVIPATWHDGQFSITGGPIALSVDPAAVTLNVGATRAVSATVNPNDAGLSYASSDTGVATVSAYGLISAVAPGVADITVTAAKAGYTTATATVAVTVVDAAPTWPAGAALTAAATGGSVNLSWPAAAGGAGVTGYQVCRDGSLLATVTSTVYTVDGLAPGKYYFTVRAVDTAGNLSAALSASAAPGLANGYITTVAGNGTLGYSGDNGPATAAQLNLPNGMAMDAAGNLYIADSENNRVRVVAAADGVRCGIAMTAGNIYTVAGTGNRGCSGDNGPAAGAQLNLPNSVAVDSAGNLYIADTDNHRVRMVAAADSTRYGIAMTAGKIYTVAGTGAAGYSGDGGPAAGAKLSYPQGVTVDSAGNLYIADNQNHRIRRVSPNGAITTVAGNEIPGYSGDNGPATGAQLTSPSAVAVDTAGNLYILDSYYQRVRMVAAVSGTKYGINMTAGNIYTVAGIGIPGYSGDGGPATGAQLTSPSAVAVDTAGNLYIADGNRVRRVAPGGIITTVAGTGVSGCSGDGGPAGGAQLTGTRGVAVDAAGNLYIADSGNQRVRYVPSPVSSSYLATLTLSGSPALNYSGAPFTYDLSSLTLAGVGQNGAAFDLTGQTVTWALISGPATISGSTLTINGSGIVSVTARALGITSNTLSLTVTNNAGSQPPALAADITGNNVGQDIELTFTDDPAWRGAIGGISIGGAALGAGQYTIAAGKITVSGAIFATAGDYAVVITAAGYANASVTQTILPPGIKTPPALAFDYTGNTAGQDIELTFTDDPIWRGAINQVSVDGAALGAGQYTIAAGKITISGAVFPAEKNYAVVITATGYANAGVTQPIEEIALEIKGDGVENPVSYTMSHLRAMPQYEHLYSTINVFPSKNFYRARGVKVSDLLAPAGVKNDARQIKFMSLDSEMAYTAEFPLPQFFNEKRYYYPHFKDVTTADGDGDGWIPGDSSGAEEVESIIALTVSIGHTKPPADFSDIDNDFSFKSLIVGQRSVLEETNPSFVKYMKVIKVLTADLEKCPNPQADPGVLDGTMTVPAGTKVYLSAPPDSLNYRQIHYTTDGSTPDVSSLIYNWSGNSYNPSRNVPLEIRKSTTLKAIFIGDGKRGGLDSDVVTYHYHVDVAMPPDLVTDTTDNTVGWPVELAFHFGNPYVTDDADWRAGISEVSVDGVVLAAGQYSAGTPGKLTISGDVFTTAKDYTIVIKAAGYTDATVTQTVLESLSEPPALAADTTGNVTGCQVELTFTDDPAWRGAITGITVDGAALAAGQYSKDTAGKITITANVFTAARDYTIVIKATGYNDATVTQTITGLVVEKAPLLTWSGDPKTTQTVTWLMPQTFATAKVQYLEAAGFTGSFAGAQEAAAAGRAFGASGADNLFSVNLTGLEPGTRYVYRVGSGADWSGQYTFTTASDTDAFSFLYLGDVHAGYSAGWDGQWSGMLDSACAAHPGLKFSLQGGDLTNADDEAEYRQFLGAATGTFSRIPFMPALGNHDGAFYLDFFTLPENGPAGQKKRFYSFDYGNAHFAVLDSDSNGDAAAAEWLRQDLQDNHSQWKFVVFHKPAYYASDDGKTATYDAIRATWVPIFEQNGVDMAFVGHQHVYMRTKPMRDNQVQADGQGITYVMGVSGPKYYAAGEDYDYVAKEVANVSNYQVVSIDGGELTLTSVQADGQVIDTYQIDKNAGVPAPVWPDGSALTAAVSGSDVVLSWPAATGDGITGYRVYQDGNLLTTVADAVYSGTVTGAVYGDAYSYTVTGLAPGSYQFSVKAVNAAQKTSAALTAGVSITGSMDTMAPVWPEGGALTAAVSGSSVALSWPAAYDNTGVTGYRIYRGTALLATVTGTVHSYPITVLASGSYTFSVIAVDAAGNAGAPLTAGAVIANSPEVALTITGDGVATTKSYTLDQLAAMEQYQQVYSAINTWPSKKWYVGKGVKLRDLLSQAGMAENAKLIKITSQDGYAVTLTVQELLNDKRYYFPHLMDSGTGDGGGHIPGSPAGAVEVEPILGLASAEGTSNPAYMNDANALLLMLGQRAVTEQTGNLFAKYVKKIEVLTSAPPKWDNPRAVPDSGTVAAGTLVRLSNDNMDDDKIYYTTDGSDPTLDSPMYNWIASRWWDARKNVLDTINHPIEIRKNTVIKAITIGPGKENSDIVTFSYQVDVPLPPVLKANATNVIGQQVDLTFDDDAAWRAAISQLSVDGAALDSVQYSVYAGKITIIGDVFKTAKDYLIEINAAGYNDAAVTLTITESSGTVEPEPEPKDVVLTISGNGLAKDKKYTLAALQAMEQYQQVYSAINTWPSKKWYVGKGVKLRDLLNQAGAAGSMIRFTAKDGYQMTLTAKELLQDRRYYFPRFMDTGGGNGGGHLPGSPAGAVEVEPIIGLVSAEGSNNPAYMNDVNTPLLMLGQRAVTEQTGNLFVKNLCKIEVLTTSPSRWDSPKAEPGSGTVAAGTKVKLSNANMDDDKIYYTTDGSTPTLDSPMYNWIASRWWSARGEATVAEINHPIEITKDTTIKAVTIGPGKEDSDVVTFTYKVMEAPSSASGTITPEKGGAVSLGNEVVIELPPGAVTSNVDVKIDRIAAPPAAPAGFKLLGGVYEFSVGDQKNYSFTKSVTIKLIFDPKALSPGETPAVYYYDETEGQWVNLGGTVSGNYITVQVDHFTKFAVMVALPASVTVKIKLDKGGTVSLNDEAVLEIPAGALSGAGEVEVKIERLAAPPAAPAGFKLAGSVYECSVGGKSSYEFAKPATIKLSFDPGLVEPGNTPAVFCYDEAKGQWVKLGGVVSGKTITVPVDHCGRFAVLTAARVILTDIAGHWAEAAIEKLVAMGAVSGYPDGTFQPDNTITRAEFATVLVKAFKLEGKGGQTFADTAGHWAADAVAAAACHGIVRGYDTNTFAPDDLITREQMAAMVVKAARPAPAAGGLQFSDGGSISGWAREAVVTATGNGIIKGYEDRTFRPQDNATRAEAVTVIVNALNSIAPAAPAAPPATGAAAAVSQQ